MNDLYSATLEELVQPIDDDIQVDGELTLGVALDRMDNTHNVVLVYESDVFLGICSPYQTLYKSRLPYTTKVKNCVVSPPRLRTSTPLFEAATNMAALRIYTLPVFNSDDDVIGMIHARTILRSVLQNDEWLNQIAQNLTPSKPVTGTADMKINQVYELMRNGTSRMIVVDAEGDLAGIISRSDIRHVFLYPTQRQRFSSRDGNPIDYTFDPREVVDQRQEVILPYITRQVLQISDTASNEEIIKRLLSSKHNSIVLVSKAGKPTGIVSTRSLLLALASLAPTEEVNIQLAHPGDAVGEGDLQTAHQLLEKFGSKMRKRLDIDYIRVSFEQPKFTTRRPATYETTLQLFPIRGEALRVTSSEKDFLQSLRSAIQHVERLEQRKSR